MRTVLFLFLLGSIFASPRARAWPPIYGPEFIFTNDEVRQSDQHREKIQKQLADAIAAICAKRGASSPERCTVTHLNYTFQGYYRVQYPDGFWFDISVDPQVLEIQATPLTYEKWKEVRNRVQADLFDTAERLGLYADNFASGGHIHIGGQSAFGEDGRLLRNFFVDFANHPELADGVLDLNYLNAPPLSAHNESVRNNLREALKAFDQGANQSATHFAELINHDVYTETIEEAASYYPPKYQAVNLWHMAVSNPEDKTVEIRSIRAQTSMDEFLKEVNLFESRIAYVKKITANGKNIPYLGLSGNMKDKQMVDAFYRYVRESGLDWKEYKSLMATSLRRKQVSARCMAEFEAIGK